MRLQTLTKWSSSTLRIWMVGRSGERYSDPAKINEGCVLRKEGAKSQENASSSLSRRKMTQSIYIVGPKVFQLKIWWFLDFVEEVDGI